MISNNTIHVQPTFRTIISLQTVVALSLMVFACDISEDDSLLNPVIPDSIQVRVVNLTPVSSIDVVIDGISAAKGLGSLNMTSFSPFLTRELFSIEISSPNRTDTVSDQQFPLSARNSYHYTYFVVGVETARQLFTLTSSSFDREEQVKDGIGRIYFINATPEKEFLVKQGCRSGTVLFNPTPGPALSTARDMPEGEYSFYLFESEATAETASARINLALGESIVLIAAEINGQVKFYSVPLFDPLSSGGPLIETIPETRENAGIRILNALENSTISAELLLSSTIVAQSILPLTLSSSTQVEICADLNGDTLLVIAENGASSRIPLQLEVGGEITAVVYRDSAGTNHVTTLQLPRGSLTEGTFQVRGVNLTSSTSVSAVAGAGSPKDIEAGTRLFASSSIGAVSVYQELPVGLYPLSLEQTVAGTFYSGGLNSFDRSFYTLFALEHNGERSMYVLDELSGSGVLQPLQVSGKRVHFFSMSPGDLTTFRSVTSVGEVIVNGVAYSYVFPSILPSERVSVAATGATSVTADFALSGYTIGITGERGREILAFPLPTSTPSPGKAGIRFLNAAPGAGTLDIHTESSTGPIEANAEYGIPTETLIRDVRRQTYSITIGGTNEEVALLSGLELSEGRNHLLIIGPKGATSSSTDRYGTLWMQE